MFINLISDNNGIDRFELGGIRRETYYQNKLSALVVAKSKIESYEKIFFCEKHGITAVCFDSSMSNISKKCTEFGITDLCNEEIGVDFGNTKAVFFTSGTTASPRGALKTKEMLELEAITQADYLSKYKFDSLLITVPLYHIYGYLFGYEIAKRIGCEIYVKELFMPQNIIEFTSNNKSACVTTPVFLRAMLKMNDKADLSNSLFISSTGAITDSEVELFYDKYGAEIIQIYGSTETGGIAVRERNDKFWMPLDGVICSVDDELKLSVTSPYASKEMFEDAILGLPVPFKTTDMAIQKNGSFEIIGRSFEILKIGGKRVSILEIEAALEKNVAIAEAQAKPVFIDALKDEGLEILVVTELDGKELSVLVSGVLKELYPEVKISAKCHKVDSIEKTFNGKKKRH